MTYLRLRLIMILILEIIICIFILTACGGNDDYDNTPPAPDSSASSIPQIPGHECHIVGVEYVCS